MIREREKKTIGCRYEFHTGSNVKTYTLKD